MINGKYCNAVRVEGSLEVYKVSEETKICLTCTLPVKECKPLSCKRYKEEKRKIKGERK